MGHKKDKNSQVRKIRVLKKEDSLSVVEKISEADGF